MYISTYFLRTVDIVCLTSNCEATSNPAHPAQQAKQVGGPHTHVDIGVVDQPCLPPTFPDYLPQSSDGTLYHPYPGREDQVI